MTDYTKLVDALRWCSVDEYVPCKGCPMDEETHGTGCFNIMHQRAAAAIDELQAVLKEADKKQAYQHDCICELTAENEELKAEVKRLEPKRGEIVRCKECIHFAQGGWCDREFDWFPVDENDFCSMAEKMEVQDESAGSL